MIYPLQAVERSGILLGGGRSHSRDSEAIRLRSWRTKEESLICEIKPWPHKNWQNYLKGTPVPTRNPVRHLELTPRSTSRGPFFGWADCNATASSDIRRCGSEGGEDESRSMRPRG